MASSLTAAITSHALDLGFSLVGIAPAGPAPRLDSYIAWLSAGMHGTMDYLAREDRLARRRDLTLILPGARSMIVVGLDYWVHDLPPEVANDPSRGLISRYAWGADYHEVMLARLEELAAFVRSRAGERVSTRAYVDTGAVLERSHAEVAGLGFAGKNTLLIHPRRGSYLFLGEIITNTALDTSPVSPMPGCGACTRCLSACPTGAFPSPYVLDARRCISYLTIEHRGFIPAELRPALGRWVFGCDICQEVCPWQRFRRTSAWADRFLPPDLERSAPSLASLLALTDEQFAHRFRGTAVYRIRRPRLVRNACVAAGNSGLEALAASLIPLLQDDQPIVRGHAAWALGRLGSGRAALASALSRETDPQARDEIAAALAGVSPA